MPKLEQPTKEMILAASKCMTVSGAMKYLYPGAFEPEPVKMEGEIKGSNGNAVAWTSDDKKHIVFRSNLKWKFTKAIHNMSCATMAPTRK